MGEARIDEYLAQIAEDGYCIIENVLSLERADAIADEVRELEDELETRPYANVFEGAKTKRIYNLLTRGPTFWAIATNPLVLSVVEGVLAPGLLVSSLSTIHIGPGEIPQPIHVDDGIINFPLPHPPIVCNTMYALTDFNEKNGATRIIPGSHKFDTTPEFGKHYDSIPATMAKIKTFPRRLQELIGFAPYQGVIGHIDRRSPMAMFDGTNTHSLANVFPPSAEE